MLAPAFHGAWNRHAVDAFERHRFETLCGEKRRRQGAGRRTGSVQAGEFSCSGFPMKDEKVSARAALHRLKDGEYGVGADGGIDGRSAAREDLRCRLGCLDLAGGRDALAGDDHGSAVRAALSGDMISR